LSWVTFVRQLLQTRILISLFGNGRGADELMLTMAAVSTLEFALVIRSREKAVFVMMD
jgi:hypothetical protein